MDRGKKELGNRAEVPDAYQMRCLLAEAYVMDWSIGTADFATAFLNAHLVDEEDGVYIVKPPQYLVEIGLEEANIYWKLDRAMYGLRKAPKKWEETRNAGLKELTVEPKTKDEKQLSLIQCNHAKNIWMIRELQEDGTYRMVGKLLMYVDDVLALGPTKVVERVLLQIKEQWSLSIKGILVRDGIESEFKVDSLRFLGCTLELGK